MTAASACVGGVRLVCARPRPMLGNERVAAIYLVTSLAGRVLPAAVVGVLHAAVAGRRLARIRGLAVVRVVAVLGVRLGPRAVLGRRVGGSLRLLLLVARGRARAVARGRRRA